MAFAQPKTSRSRRQVALSPTAALELWAHREQQQALSEELGRSAGDLVSRRIDGSPLRPDTVTHAFADLVKKAGVLHVRLLDLRHTHATLMMEQGINPKIVSERLGHASLAIPLDLYSHVSPGLQAEAAQKFDQAMARQHENAESVAAD